jgi:hypothetical protein
MRGISCQIIKGHNPTSWKISIKVDGLVDSIENCTALEFMWSRGAKIINNSILPECHCH